MGTHNSQNKTANHAVFRLGTGLEMPQVVLEAAVPA
jgi:hypothetical protein